MGKKQLIPLDIAMDYPAKWSFERVLRDLIQNFYDSVGYERFGKDFEFQYDRNDDGNFDVKMQTHDHPFSYEWLIYIGGSTKTQEKGKYIGKFGEGFKICMLNLLNNGITDVVMHSQNWKLTPCTYEKEVGQIRIPMLGYHCEPASDDNSTLLTIKGIPQIYRRYLEEALLHFFYPENPLFGDKIGEGSNFIAYHASKIPIPCQDPLCIKGIMYGHYLARGRLPFPVHILIKEYYIENDSRKRDNFSDVDTWHLMNKVVYGFDPECSLQVLMIMKNYWKDKPKNWYDCSTWYYVICQLVRNVARDKALSDKFRTEFPDLWYIERKSDDRTRNSLIDQAQILAREKSRSIIVNPIFRLLGARSLVDELAHPDPSALKKPDEKAQMKIDLLYKAAMCAFPGALHLPCPEVLIGTKSDTMRDPLRYAIRNRNKSVQSSARSFDLVKLVMSADQFDTQAFDHTFVWFCDMLLHSFGGCRSRRLNLFLTDLCEWIPEHAQEILKYKKEWEALQDAGIK